MIASTETDALLAIDTTLVTAVVALAFALARTRERVIRLEEWVRQHERRELGDRG